MVAEQSCAKCGKTIAAEDNSMVTCLNGLCRKNYHAECMNVTDVTQRFHCSDGCREQYFNIRNCTVCFGEFNVKKKFYRCTTCNNKAHVDCVTARWRCTSCAKSAEIAKLQTRLTEITNISTQALNVAEDRIAKLEKLLNETMQKALTTEKQLQEQLQQKDKAIEELKKKSDHSGLSPDEDLLRRLKSYLGSNDGGDAEDHQEDSSGSDVPSIDYDTFFARDGQQAFINRKPHVPGSPAAMQAILGRKYVSRLPEFDGDPKKWTAFVKTFRESTVDGNYTDKENVKRLQESLSGPARDLLGESLFMTNEASILMWDLQRVCGRNSTIAIELSRKLRDIETCKDSSDPKVYRMSAAICHYVSTMKALGRHSDLRNTLLLSEVEVKLCPQHIESWMDRKAAITAQQLREPDFEDLNSFLFRARDCIIVTGFSDVQNLTACKSKNRSASKSNFVNAHGKSLSCYYCKETHLIHECSQFAKLSACDRYKFIKKNSICHQCLGKKKHDFKTCNRHKCVHCDGDHHEFIHGVEPSDSEDDSDVNDG